MTKDEILNMPAGREIDIVILKTLWGIKKIYYEDYDTDKEWPLFIPSGKPWRTHKIDATPVPQFTENISATWQVVKKMEKAGWLWDFSAEVNGSYTAMFQKFKDGEFYGVGCDGKLYLPPTGETSANTDMLAICRASLLCEME